MNPSQTTLGKGLASWAKFGSTVTRVETGVKYFQSSLLLDKTRVGQLEDPVFAQQLCNGDINMRNITSSRRVKDDKYVPHYGDWYISPSQWNQKFHNTNKETQNNFSHGLGKEQVC